MQFKKFALGKDPAQYMKDVDWDFDEVLHWSRAFHILIPIIDGTYITMLVKRLKGDGDSIRGATLADGAGFGEKKFYHCTCSDYLHYAWCVHVCCKAFQDKLILRYPKNLDPTVILSKKKGRRAGDRKEGDQEELQERSRHRGGRAKKARQGGARDHDGQ